MWASSQALSESTIRNKEINIPRSKEFCGQPASGIQMNANTFKLGQIRILPEKTGEPWRT
jgi:hypothetical protein